jgi:hypothetical protein
MSLVLAAALERIRARSPSWAGVLPAAAAATVLLLDLGEVRHRVHGQIGAMDKYHVLASAVAANGPPAVAFPHFRWPMRTNYFAGYADGYRAFATERPGARFRVPDASAEPLPGEWVVVDPRMFGRTGEWWLPHDPLPPWMENPPAEWRVRMKIHDVRVVEAPAPDARQEEHSTDW